jgi:hypothetical protein
VTRPYDKPYGPLAIKTGSHLGLDPAEVRKIAYRHKEREQREFIWSLGSVNIYSTTIKTSNGFPLEWYYAWSCPGQRIEFFLNSETEEAIRQIARRKLKGEARA